MCKSNHAIFFDMSLMAEYIVVGICSWIIYAKSNFTSALCSKFWMKKSQNTSVWLSKMVLAQQSLTPAADWLDGLID
jgi:hypothetical protein